MEGKTYGMLWLSGEFAKHAEKAKDSEKEMKRNWEESHPNEPLPEYMDDDFCISSALRCMVENIMRLSAEVVLLKHEKETLRKRLDEIADVVMKEDVPKEW